MQNNSGPQQLLDLLSSKGGEMYGGEQVTQLEHALQAALLAEEKGSTPELITAALLHDIGHLLSEEFAVAEGLQQDDRHEWKAMGVLKEMFPETVTTPIQMHVAAKRYLCAIDPSYEAGLSEASINSLRLQGGKMTSEEVEQFGQHPLLDDVLQLRRWDDQAKVPGLETPPLSHFEAYVEQAVGGTQ